MHIYIYTSTYIHTYIPTYLHTYISTDMHAYIHAYTHTYIYMYIYIYTHVQHYMILRVKLVVSTNFSRRHHHAEMSQENVENMLASYTPTYIEEKDARR